MQILVDYLTFTSKFHSLSELLEITGLTEVEWIAGRSYNGWHECLYSNGIKILLGGREDICVDMSGKGCRFLETCNNNEFNWENFLIYLIDNSGDINVSRLDIASDDKEGILKFDTLINHSKARKYISRARSVIWIDGAEQAIYFGSKTSKVRLRIYNKARERGVEGHWIRAEFQFRDRNADSFLLNLKRERHIGKTYNGVLSNFLRFTTTSPAECNGNYDKLRITKWWQKFIHNADKIKNIYVGGMEYNYDTLEHYIMKQVAPSLRTFIMANGGNIEPLLELISKAKLSTRQRELLKSVEKERENMRYD